MAKEHYKYEPAQKDEPNTISFEVKRNETIEEKAQAILDLIIKKSNELNNNGNK